MKFLKFCLLVASFGLLLTLVSCSSETTPDDTKAFLSGLNAMMSNAYMSESSQALESFGNSNPPGPAIVFKDDVESPTANLRKMRDPMGLDTLYGTWDYVDIQGWIHVNPNNPANAILFTWDYTDTAYVSHAAELLIDSLEFYEESGDTIPTNIWIGLNVDNDDIAWIKFSAHYVSADVADEASIVYEIVGYYQLGASIVTNVEVDTTLLDSLDFDGTIHIWAIDRITNYQVDYYVTGYGDDSWLVELEDSDDWEMELNVSEVVEVDVVDYTEYERRDIEGEITHGGEVEATIEGFAWDPEDEDHPTTITIIFSDDTEEDFQQYAGMLNLVILSM